MKRLLVLLIGMGAIAAGIGYYLGAKSTPASVLTNVSQGAAYQGGYDQAKDAGVEAGQRQGPAGQASQALIVVNDGESIQAAVKQALPGTTIQIMPGVYHETVYIDKDSIQLIGVIEAGKRAVLDGQGKLNDAILYSGNNVVVENLEITGYKGNGIMGQAGNNFEIRNNLIVDTGIYGIFPQLGKNGVVEYNVVSGIADAAIYIGMSDNVHVAHNQVFDSVAGIEIENSRHAIVENNHVYNNTGGILAFITPGLPIKTTYDVIIRNNFILSNNHENFGAPGSTVAGIPAGTGILVMAADEVVIENNLIVDHKTVGVLIVDHANASNVTADPDADPNPDKVAILNNTMMNNGYDTIPEIKAFMALSLKQVEPDIAHVSAGQDNCIINRHRYNTVGLSDFTECEFTHTDAIKTYLLDTPVPPRDIAASERGKIAYLGVCTGCHSYNGRLIGPSIQTIQALYFEDPEGLATYLANPIKKRPDYPEMPSQAYLGEETLLAVAKYVLSREN
ncbi:parallel beta-helix domain-containing protein [Arenicella xantha]|uniref:Parallel beta-helix repeat protein n=1 Tax=Arenicella xantha TaxID=644221 RepID=A0A395JG02_9GAMM|nr:parallel beta-helix domain-containing protein [Arenicella xantha]RBP48786.1 parallel beta-helix repeat protein [Arenicella xantha]